MRAATVLALLTKSLFVTHSARERPGLSEGHACAANFLQPTAMHNDRDDSCTCRATCSWLQIDSSLQPKLAWTVAPGFDPASQILSLYLLKQVLFWLHIVLVGGWKHSGFAQDRRTSFCPLGRKEGPLTRHMAIEIVCARWPLCLLCLWAAEALFINGR